MGILRNALKDLENYAKVTHEMFNDTAGLPAAVQT